MTTNGSFKKLKKILVLCLSLVFLLCTATFTFSACGTSEDDDDSTYTKVEEDEALLSNGSFEYGVADVKLTAFPRSSVTGWTSSTDNGATTSAIRSGIIDVSKDAFSVLRSNLYSDDDFVNYVAAAYGFDVDALEEAIKTENPDADSDEIDELLKDLLLNGKDEGEVHTEYLEQFKTPGVHSGQTDTKVYMLNNYRDSTKYFNFGTAQKLESSSSLSIENGNYGKVSVWVKTSEKMFAASEKSGANIRITATVNGVAQEVYAAYGIIASEWTEYVVYVKADETASCSIKVTLGLGFGGGSSSLGKDYTEGTVYFDDVEFEQLSKDEYDAETLGKTVETKTLSYVSSSSSDTDYVKAVAANENKALLFDLTVENGLAAGAGYFNEIKATEFTATNGFTTSNTDGRTSATILGSANSSIGTTDITDEAITVSGLKNAAYYIELDSDKFQVLPEKYLALSFKVSNSLSRFDSNGITVFVKDYNGTEYNLTSSATYTTSNDSSVCNLIIKNNFGKSLYGTNQNDGIRTFKIIIYVGPYDFTSKLNADDFATGSVTFSDFKYASGDSYEYVRTYSSDYSSYTVSNTDKTENYEYFSLISSRADKTVALYAGEISDYTADSSSSGNFTVSPSDIGTIVTRPANVSSYIGIPADHAYVNQDSELFEVNKNNNAGLINTKYLSAYTMLPNVQTAIGAYTDDIQPLVIYNDVASAYGYIGPELSIAASTYYTISVKVRVYGDAKAYIYLVDTSTTEKQIESIDVLSNTDGYSYTQESDTVNHKLMRVIDSSMMQTTGDDRGWLTVTFYIATGANAKTLRLELWNGGRDNQTSTQSQGYVFFDKVETSSTFTEPESWTSAFTTDGILFEAAKFDASIKETAVLYQRPLTTEEKEFNKTASTDEKIEYNATYIYAENKNTVYAIYNTIDPVADTSSSDDSEEETQSCASFSSGTFWLQFSTILLAAVLVFALGAIVVRAIIRKRKANKNDAKSYYTVKSRYTKPKDEKEVKNKKEDIVEENESSEEILEQSNLSPDEETVAPEEQTLDEYVYNDVQDFGDAVAEPIENESSDDEK